MDDVKAEPADELEPELPPKETPDLPPLGTMAEELGKAPAAAGDEEAAVTLLPVSAEPGEKAQDSPTPRPSVTFMGNNVDLASLGALASAILMIFICLTCNMGIYCLPVAPLALGLVGLLMASRSVDVRRTRFWSWIGVGTGTIMLILLLIAFLLYVGLVWMMIHYSTQEAIIQALSPLAGV